MTNLEKYQLSVFERCENGEISEEERDILLESASEYMEESVSPVRILKKKIEKIKEDKPSEYTDNEDVKKFVDNCYDDIMEASKILEKEPKELRKIEITTACGEVLAAIGYIGGASLMYVSFVPGLIITILSIIGMIIPIVIQYIRTNDDQEVYNNLMKIKNALVKVKNKKGLPESTRKKVIELIEKINDAEEEISARLKVHKESVDEYKLSLYERCEAGLISKEERNVLLESIDESTFVDDGEVTE